MVPKRVFLCLAASAGALAAWLHAPRSAQANWSAAFSSASQYVAKWSFVPDYDQRRALLPNTGRMYCVPTAAMNWMAYIARHGYPQINPPGDHHFLAWLQPQWYNPVTGWLDTMGILMNTDENNGTNGTGAMNGLNAWLPNNFFILNYYLKSNFTPRFDHMANWTLNKVPVMPIVGWYKDLGVISGSRIIQRSGGHAVSLAEVERSGSQRVLGIRDPADEQAILFNQSLPATEKYAMMPTPVFVNGGFRTMDKVVNYGSGYIDGFFAIIPLFGLTSADDSLNLHIMRPNKFSWDSSAALQNIFMPAGAGTIKDVRMLPGTPEFLVSTNDVVVGGPTTATAWKVDPLTEAVSPLVRLSSAIVAVVMGRDRQLYILDATGTIHCYNVDVDPPVEEATVIPPNPVVALAYDDLSDTLLALSTADHIIHKFAADLAPAGDVPLPAAIPMMGANASLGISPTDGSMYMTSDTTPTIYHLSFSAAGGPIVEPIGEGALVRPQALNVGDKDELYVSTNGALKVFMKDAAGAWMEDAASPFAGMAVHGPVFVPHSRSNIDRATQDLPENFHVLPTEFSASIVDCLYDLDLDLMIGPTDLLQLLGGWGQPFGPNELLGMLAAWGRCPTTP